LSENSSKQWDENTPLIRILEIEDIPTKSLIHELGLSMEYKSLNNKKAFLNQTPLELGKTTSGVKKAIKEFTENKQNFIGAITAVGMLVVFVSLLLIGIVIAQLKHLNRQKKVKPEISVVTSVGKITTAEPDVSTNSIVAVITALHMHVKEVQDKKKLALTWNRSPVSMWKASNHVHLINAQERRRNR